MTVKELIEKLQMMNGDLPVCYIDDFSQLEGMVDIVEGYKGDVVTTDDDPDKVVLS